MNYQKVYQQLINKRKHVTFQGYGEKHHIIPRCMGGTNKKENIVRLTAREHFIAHALLCKIYPNDHKLLFAFNCMNNKWGEKRDYKTSSNRFYEKCKIEARKLIGDNNRGSKNGMYGKSSPNKGKHLTEETRQKISNSLKGSKNGMYGKKRPEYIGQAVAKANKERVWTKEARQRISDFHRGEKNRWYGQHLTEDVKLKASVSKCYNHLLKFSTNEINIDEWDNCRPAGCMRVSAVLKIFGSFDNMLTCVNACFGTSYVSCYKKLKGLLVTNKLLSEAQCKAYKKDVIKFKSYYSKIKQIYEKENITEDLFSFIDKLLD